MSAHFIISTQHAFPDAAQAQAAATAMDDQLCAALDAAGVTRPRQWIEQQIVKYCATNSRAAGADDIAAARAALLSMDEGESDLLIDAEQQAKSQGSARVSVETLVAGAQLPRSDLKGEQEIARMTDSKRAAEAARIQEERKQDALALGAGEFPPSPEKAATDAQRPAVADAKVDAAANADVNMEEEEIKAIDLNNISAQAGKAAVMPSAGEIHVHRQVFAAAMNVLRGSKVEFRSGLEQELNVARFLRSVLEPDPACPRRRRFLLFIVQLAWAVCTKELGVKSDRAETGEVGKEEEDAQLAAAKALDKADEVLHEEAAKLFFEQQEATLHGTSGDSATPKESSSSPEKQSPAKQSAASPAKAAAAGAPASVINIATPPGALAAAAAALVEPTTAQLADVLHWAYAQSDHIIRRDMHGSAYDPLFPGSLVTEFQSDDTKHQWPFSLVWAYDEIAKELRCANQTLAEWQKQMPLLPFWSFGVLGNGDCLMHSCLLADVDLPFPQQSVRWQSDAKLFEKANAAAATVQQAARDPITGWVKEESSEAVAEACSDYRSMSDSTHSHQLRVCSVRA
jgi:hypothetical protein